MKAFLILVLAVMALLPLMRAPISETFRRFLVLAACVGMCGCGEQGESGPARESFCLRSLSAMTSASNEKTVELKTLLSDRPSIAVTTIIGRNYLNSADLGDCSVDPWGSTYRVKMATSPAAMKSIDSMPKSKAPYCVEIYSIGRNGRDELGDGDDICHGYAYDITSSKE